MRNLNRTLLCWAVAGLFLRASILHAADEPAADFTGDWNWSVTLGVSNWDGLASLQPARGGRFDSSGFALEFAGHRYARRWAAANVLVGVDLGAYSAESSIPGNFENLTQRGLYLTPSMKLRFGERRKRHVDLQAGAGWYRMDIAEILDAYYELAVPFEKDALGGYLGISGGFGSWFLLDLKVHFANFGAVTGLGPDTGDLTGPIYILSLGAAFGN